MSRFSDYLRQLIEERGEPISQIAKKAGLERTSIHKALNDERILPYISVKKLERYFQLSLSQIRELNRYYDMLLQGEDRYRIWEEICEVLGDLVQLHYISAKKQNQPDEKEGIEAELLQSQVCRGRYHVNALIHAVFRCEVKQNSEISMYLPSEETIGQELISFWQKGRQFTVHQIVTFLPERLGIDGELQNIIWLRKLLPISFISRGQYFAWYYFNDAEQTNSLQPLPYYIIIGRYLILLDRTLSAAQVQTNPEIIDLYQKYFKQLTEECQPFNSYSSDVLHILQDSIDNTSEDGLYNIMAQPCLGHYYTGQIVEKYIRHEIPQREMVIEKGIQRFERLVNLKSHYYIMFDESGLRQFTADGIVLEMPLEFVKPMEPEDRVQMLRSLYRDIESGAINGCIVDQEKLQIPPFLSIVCDPKYGLHIYAIQGYIDGDYACNLHIQEPGIGAAFTNFIRALPKSSFVYPKEKTLRILEELIEELTEKEREEV